MRVPRSPCGDRPGAWSVPGAGGTPLPTASPLPDVAQPAPLTLRPGPIYAVDGDPGIGQRILYSILQGEWARPRVPLDTRPRPTPTPTPTGQSRWDPGPQPLQGPPNPPAPPGNQEDTFVINADSGNLTMAKSVPSPKTFRLLVKVGARPGPAPAPALSPGTHGHCRLPPQAEQEDRARYAVAQVTVQALAAAGSPPRFPESWYRGTVPLGSGPGVAVSAAADPSQPLRIQAQDPDFPVGAAGPGRGGPPLRLRGWVGGRGGTPGSLGPRPGPQLGHHLPHHQQLRLPDGRGGRAGGGPAAAGRRLLRGGEAGQPGGGGSPGVRRTSPLPPQVQAINTVTGGAATTSLEVRVPEQEPPPTGGCRPGDLGEG